MRLAMCAVLPAVSTIADRLLASAADRPHGMAWRLVESNMQPLSDLFRIRVATSLGDKE
jgi:hypothetical protein